MAGILNGTCNFILSEMEKTRATVRRVLAEAQALGFAEADPTTDVGGFDAGHKITILAALAFGCAPTFAAARITGIDDIELLDIQLAKALGYRIKLVASAARTGRGGVGRRRPCSDAAGPSAGGNRRRAERPVHREPAYRADLRAGAGRRRRTDGGGGRRRTSPTS